MAFTAELRRRCSTAVRGGSGIALALWLSACASPTEPVPLAPGAINTGTYPNLNIPAPGAASQLSTADQTAKRSELASAQARQAGAAAGPAASPAEQARLRLLAQTHGQETLNAITGEP